MNSEDKIYIYSKEEEMPTIKINGTVIKDSLGIKIESKNKSSNYFLFEQIDKKPNITKELFRCLKTAKYNIIQTKALSIIQIYYITLLKHELTEQVFIQQIKKIFNKVKEALIYKKAGELTLYKDFEDRFKNIETTLLIDLGSLKNARFAIVTRELTNPLKNRGALPLIPEPTNKTKAKLASEFIKYFEECSITTRIIYYLIIEISEQEKLSNNSIFQITEKELAGLLEFSYSSKDEKKHTRRALKIALDELRNLIKIKDPETGAFTETRLIDIRLSKAHKTADIYYNIALPTLWNSGNFIKINTKTLARVKNNIKKITCKRTQNKILETAELIAINEAEGKKNYTLDNAPLYELQSWKQKQRREAFTKNLNVIDSKEIGLVNKKIAIKEEKKV